MGHYHVRECQSEACRFRYPVLPAEMPATACPRCGSITVLRGQHALNREPVSAPADDAGPVVVALLDNVRSVFNVGSMFRIADGAGIAHLHLAGITPTPEHPKLAKTALGAERDVPWTYHPNALQAARRLGTQGFCLWALEETAVAEPLFAPDQPESGPIALIVGHEIVGVDPDVLAQCSRVLRIPMLGRKRSLNVAVAFGIVAYALRFRPPGEGQ